MDPQVNLWKVNKDEVMESYDWKQNCDKDFKLTYISSKSHRV